MIKWGTLVYHLAVYCTFVFLYWSSDMRKNFTQAAKDKQNSIQYAAYFGAVTHSTAGYGDCFPSTYAAKTLVMGHLACVMMPQFLE